MSACPSKPANIRPSSQAGSSSASRSRRALALSPGLLLLDEPLSALDARVRARLRGEIRDLQQRLRLTTIMVTHDQEEALTMSDRIVVMSNGRIEQVGTPDEIYGRPATAFVADFVGKMNPFWRDASSPASARMSGVPCSTSARRYSSAKARPSRSAFGRRTWWCATSASIRTIACPVQVGVMEFIGNHFATTLHASGTSLNFSADFSINAVRDLGISSGATIEVAAAAETVYAYLPSRCSATA